MLSVITKGKENPTLENDLGVDGDFLQNRDY